MNHIFDGPEGPIKPIDYKYIFITVCNTPVGNEVLLDFLVTNFKKICSDLPDGKNVVLSMFYEIAYAATNDCEFDRVSSYNLQILLKKKC